MTVDKTRITCAFGSLITIFSFSVVPLLSLTSDEILTAYRTLREVPLDSSRIFTVEDIVIKKDAAEFRLESGQFYFYEPILDRVTGGLFAGEGVFRLEPADQIEQDHILRLNDWGNLDEPIEELFILFADDTYETVFGALSPHAGSIESRTKKRAERLRKDLREKFYWNLPARIIADLSSGNSRGIFAAFIKLQDDRTFYFEVDPHEREEISLIRYKKDRFQKWLSTESWCSISTGDTQDEFHDLVDTEAYRLDITIDKKQVLTGVATIEFFPQVEGERMLHMNLAPTLRVESVEMSDGIECYFIQEDEEEDADLWVLFPEILEKGKKVTLTISYSGEEVVKNAGGGNYYVKSRTSWYPNFRLFRDRALYKVTFSVPKGRTLIATGTLTKKWSDSEKSYSEWESEIPFAVFGFNYGKFQKKSQKDEGKLVEVTCYTNPGLKDELFVLRKRLEESPGLRAAAMIHPQDLTTKKMTKDAAIQGLNAYNVFTHYFGEIPFKKIKISQQTYRSFGQGWPTLIYFPYTALFKPHVRDALGFKSEEFFDTVASHEVAHQWWGHIVGSETYHDLWLEEGFAQYSAALYQLKTEGESSFVGFMKNQQERIVEEVRGGDRLADVGPISLGRRLNTIENPRNHHLVYEKGAFILHMLRMMLYDYRNRSDEKFADMMRDYVFTHFNQSASTESFQAIVEKHFGQDMAWFFKQWVYGTAIPSYRFQFIIQPTTDGKHVITLEVTQEDVPSDFRVLLPVMIHFKNGFNVVSLEMEGNNTVKRQFKVPVIPEKITPNPFESVLASEIKEIKPSREERRK
jgi:hypothetical protein